MDTLLAYATNTVVVGAVCLVLGVVFGQKIKDYIVGTPSELRSVMSTLEANTKAEVKAATADVFSKLLPTSVKPAVPAPAPAPVVAPAPHA